MISASSLVNLVGILKIFNEKICDRPPLTNSLKMVFHELNSIKCYKF